MFRSAKTHPHVFPTSDGDIACPDDFSTVAWDVTKAGHVAQAPCLRHKIGLLKRACGPDGTWGPVHDSCTDSELLDLFHRAWVNSSVHLPYPHVYTQCPPWLPYPYICHLDYTPSRSP